MKKNEIILLVMFLGICINCFGADPTSKKVFKYAYDAAGNRTKREYILATPCPGDPRCNERKKNDSILDSLFIIAQDIEIKQPDIPTEKPNYDGTPELKNVYPNPTKGLFLVEFTDNITNAILLISDINGIILSELVLDGRQWEIDLSLFPASTYILNIKTKEGKTYTKKIIKL